MWHGDDETMQGLGCPGGCQGTDGPMYQWVQGVDGLGATVGYWRQADGQQPGAPYTRNAAPFLGGVAQAADGNLYQWVQGVDGLGSPFGFWKRFRGLRKLVKHAFPLARQFATFVPGGAAALTAATPFLRKVGVEGADGLGALYEAPDGSMYQVQGIGAGDELEGLADDDELRGLSEEELQGFAGDDELSGFGAEDELNGFAADDELNGFGAEDELNGFGADEALEGFGAGDDLEGVGADDDLNGLADEELQGIDADDAAMDGYVRDTGMNGVDGFRPDGPRRTPPFAPPPNAPMWAPLW